jgi:hypothetical protein
LNTLRRPLAILLALAAGCADASRPDAAVFRDAHLSEEVRVGGHAADLVPVGSLVIAADGMIVVGQSQDRLVRFFGADGTDLGQFGRAGQGPGEFLATSRLGWLADTLWILDGQARRITLLSPKREFGRSLTPPAGAHAPDSIRHSTPDFHLLVPVALHGDGLLTAALFTVVGQELPPAFSASMAYGRIDTNGLVHGIALKIRPVETSAQVPGAGVVSLPFRNRPVHAVSANGEVIALAEAGFDELHLDQARVTAVRFTGDTLFSRMIPVPLVPIPRTVGDSVLRAGYERLSRADPRLREAFRREATVPEFYPPLERLVVGQDGSVWIEHPVTPERKPYSVLSAEGHFLGLVHFPARSRLMEAQRDRVWILERDEMDVESIVRYGVTWR